MATETITREDLLIFRNEEMIARERQEAMQFAPLFQPFIDELFRTKFKAKPDIEKIRTWILSGSLDGFLKSEALLLDEGISKLNLSPAKKLELIEPENIFSNYSELKKLYGRLPLKLYEKAQINRYVLDDNNKLTLTDEENEEIMGKGSFYVNSIEEKQIYMQASEVLDKVRALFKETGYKLTAQNAVTFPFCPTGDKWAIDPINFGHQMKARKANFN